MVSNSSRDSLLQSNLSAMLSDSPIPVCLILRPSSFMYFGYFVTNILIMLPLCILILYLGFKQRKQQRRTNFTAAATAHSDSFTYHMVVMELIGVVGMTLSSCSIFTRHIQTYRVGYCLWSIPWYAELFINILSCVERFLAVLHPIAYRGLRSERGTRLRNISLGCVWFLVIGQVNLLTLKTIAATVDFFLLVFCLVVIVMCSLSVLCVLIRPGPGNQSSDRGKVDQSKRRVFRTILAILGVLLTRCSWNLVWASFAVSGVKQCIVFGIGVWFNLPSRLVLPLLFLHKAGLLCRNAK